MAEAAALARERDQAIVAALVEVESKEAVCENATAKERAKLLLDEERRWALTGTGVGQESLQLTLDGAVEHALLGAVSLEGVARARTGGVRARSSKSGRVHSGE